MDEKTAQEVVKTGIIRESDNNEDMFGSNPIFSLPKIKNKEALLLTHPKNKNIKNMELNGMKMKTKYENNVWLGGGNYREKFNEVLLIVDNDTFKKISTPEIYMKVVELNKTYTVKKFSKDDNTTQNQTELYELLKK